MTVTRRAMIGVVGAMAAAGALAGLSAGASAQSLDALAKTAAGKGPVIWYESSKPEQIAEVVAAFNETYPDIAIEYVRNTGGNSLAARVIQESQAGAGTASFVTGGSSHIGALAARDLLVEPDWAALGVDPSLTPVPFTLAIAASVYVALWNTDAVAAGTEPKTWDDFLDPRYKGRVGSWVRAAGFAMLAKAWGADQARDYVRAFAAQEPLLYKSTYPLAQQVAAGEVDVAVGIYHTAQPPILAGAPIGLGVLDPSPMNTIWGGVVKTGGNPEGGQVLAAWLASPAGAGAYETATGRGNPYTPGTKAHAMLEGKTISEWPIAENDTYGALQTEFNEIFAAGGKAAN